MKKFVVFMVLLCGFLLARPYCAHAKDANGRFVFAYLENGAFSEFTSIKNQILAELDKKGLAGQYVMPQKLMFSPGWSVKPAVVEEAAKKIMDNKEVDLVFSMGTVATKALLAQNNGHTPIVGIDISDPVRSGIIPDQHSSGTKNLTLHYVPYGWLRVFNRLHQIAPFKKLGLIYEDTVNGRTYANLEDSIEAGRSVGFAVVEYPHYNPAKRFESCMEGVTQLIKQGVDAVFLSEIPCFDKNIVKAEDIVKKATDAGVVTLSNIGDLHVQSGALASVSSFTDHSISRFYAGHIEKILLDGATPGDLPINVSFSPEIIINLDTASQLGIDFDLPVLLSADKIYDGATDHVAETDKADNNE